jgi:uncharacterized protein YjiS (DUF1127 family)
MQCCNAKTGIPFRIRTIHILRKRGAAKRPLPPTAARRPIMSVYDAKAHPALSGYDLPEAHGVTHHVRRLFGGLSLWLQERRAYSRAFEELQSLSDRELADIGISRADISFIARDGARARIRNGL